MMMLTSPSFSSEGRIPAKHTCDGQDLAPTLEISGVPENAKSLVMIVDDPDAPDPAHPRVDWVHWVLYNIPPGTRRIAEGTMPEGSRSGLNDWKEAGYRGPCPPVGIHRYFFRLYALDRPLPDLGRVTKSELEAAMRGHVLAHAELMGRYGR
ncbi:MAG: YbhB/YbcL family Raf kinase inhibitor-like protein [Burkholderiales bacterium]|nr:YbhB/YbcL family Raf kinase inhibitor-like protein [Burkholderiales bacterium]